MSNPIYEGYFKGRAFLAGKVFDDPRSVQFRKQWLMTTWLAQSKPTSIPTAGLYERRGSEMRAHVLWLHNELGSLRESATFRRRTVRKSLKADNAIKGYLNKVHQIIKRFK